MTDNFNNYREYIRKCGGLPETNEKGNLDKYYVVELIRRGKDNPELPASNYHFRNYYVYSWRDLERYEAEIKGICDLLRLRAYCSVNYKRMSQVALDTLAESARRIAANDYKKFYNIFESCSGKFVDHSDAKWVVDIDGAPLDAKERVRLHELEWYINKMESSYQTSNVIYTMPTRSGYHLITHPFNLQQFQSGFRTELGSKFGDVPDVKKNHLTLLYENL